MSSALNRRLARNVRSMCAGLEGKFLNSLIQIGRLHKKTLEELLIEIDTQRVRGQKRSAAARLFVLDFYLTETERIAPLPASARSCNAAINSFWDSPSLHLRSESLREGERLIALAREIEHFSGKLKH